MSDKAISKWENGDGLPDVATVPSLAIALNTSVDAILNGGAVSVRRMISSLGSKQDTQILKQVIASVVSVILSFISYQFLWIALVMARGVFSLGLFFLFLALMFMFFSYFIYTFFKKRLQISNVVFSIFEIIMTIFWVSPLLLIVLLLIRAGEYTFIVMIVLLSIIITLKVFHFLKHENSVEEF